LANKGEINMSEANEQACGESNASLCSGAAGKAPANGPDVQGTGLPGFAELRARAIAERDLCVKAQQEIESRYGCNDENAMYLGVEIDTITKFLQWLDDLEADAKDAS
jgi:hypothetical protein